MAPRQETIIVRRARAGKQHGAHGGAWKVAFADFTLAMMALFLVLWIMQVADQKERETVVKYLNGELYPSGDINPFDLRNIPSLIDLQGQPSVQQPVVPTPASGDEMRGPALRTHVPEGKWQPKAGMGPKLNAIIPGEFATQVQLEVLARQIQRVVDQAGMGKNVQLAAVPQGIRIRIHDNNEQSMFKVGQAQMRPYFEDLLLALAPVLQQVKNQLIISGHTDSLPYVGRSYTNWELSSERALIARQTIEFGGVRQGQILQVNRMADRVPFIDNEPFNPANRRVEILILTKEASEQIQSLAGGKALFEANEAARFNQPRDRYQ